MTIVGFLAGGQLLSTIGLTVIFQGDVLYILWFEAHLSGEW